MYGLIRAARTLGVPPWELLEQPLLWKQWALIVENAENYAAQVRNRNKR